jgi:hypothetical protein
MLHTKQHDDGYERPMCWSQDGESSLIYSQSCRLEDCFGTKTSKSFRSTRQQGWKLQAMGADVMPQLLGNRFNEINARQAS